MYRTSVNTESLLVLSALALALVMTNGPGVVQAETISLEESMSITSTLEGWHSIIWGLREQYGYSVDPAMTWECTYSSVGATFLVNGQFLSGLSFSLSYTGSLSGPYGQDRTWSGTWSGTIGNGSFSATDTATWLWDAQNPNGGYFGLDFRQDGTGNGLETASLFSWVVRGTEIAGAVTAGAITENVTVGIGAGSLLWAISNTVLSPTPPPPPPAPPVPPVIPPPVGPGGESIIINGNNNHVYKFQKVGMSNSPIDSDGPVDIGNHTVTGVTRSTMPVCGNNVREGSEECDGTDNSACVGGEVCCDCTCRPPPCIPTVSEWALVVMTLIVFVAGTIFNGRRRIARA